MNAYEGSEKYIFVSYAHKDSAVVLPILNTLQEHGCRIWCDEKLIVGENYNAAIARHLRNCDAVLFCLSENWMASPYCRNEASVGIEQFRKKVALLYLEDCIAHDEVLMLLAGKHSVRTSDPQYLDKLLQSPALRDCIGQTESVQETHNEPSDDRMQQLLALANTPEGRAMLEALLGKPISPVTTSASEPQPEPKPDIVAKVNRTANTAATRKKPAKKQSATKAETLPTLNPRSTASLSPEAAMEVEGRANQISEFLSANRIRFLSIDASYGPTVTQYKITPAPSQSVTTLRKLTDQLELVLAVDCIRFTTDPTKGCVIYEVPNAIRQPIKFRDRLASPKFSSNQNLLPVCLGADHSDGTVVLDLAKMPHLLIGGVTGSGKSTCLHTIILSLIERKSSDELRLILIDPKNVEFSVYRDIPHLGTPVITNPFQAANTLSSIVDEMEQRYELIKRVGVRDVTSYQKLAEANSDLPKMPYTVIIIDELADLMILARKEVEEAITRLAQKARAAGIYLVLSTQRPSVDVITGMLKANVPSRIAFRTVSSIDSKNILDTTGAEKLCGNGDMLFLPVGSTSPLRVQGAFVSDAEIHEAIRNLLSNSNAGNDDQEFIIALDDDAARFLRSRKDLITEIKENPLLLSAIEVAVSRSTLSTSLLQRSFQIGYGRAAKIIDTLELFEIVAPYEGNGNRKVLISEEELRIIQKAVENY